jgi:hypothetical protein
VTQGIAWRPIVVSQPFAQDAGPAKVQVWAQILAETATRGASDNTTKITDSLMARFAAAGLEVAPVEGERLAEQLADPASAVWW